MYINIYTSKGVRGSFNLKWKYTPQNQQKIAPETRPFAPKGKFNHQFSDANMLVSGSVFYETFLGQTKRRR